MPKDCNSFGIVVRFEEPVRGSDNIGGNQYFKDMVIGVMDEDGDYYEFMAASRHEKFANSPGHHPPAGVETHRRALRRTT